MKRKIETPLIHTTKHKPWGNYMIDAVSGIKEIRTPGLGLFSKLSDAFLIDFFQSYILFPLKYTSLNSIKEFKQNLNTLIVLMRCSKAFYAYTTHDAFFRDITIQYFGGNFHFLDSWRNTFISSFCKLTSITFTPYPLIEINHLYSDYLFQSFHGGSVDINVLCDVLMDENGDIDVSRDSIPRRALLSMDSFNSEFANLNLPVIITDIVDKWIAYKKWNMKSMVDRFANVVFRAESLDTTMKNYCSYSNKIESRQVLDESPLYLFDKKFVESCPELGQEYAVPEYFQQDLFGLMKDKRPDYRWIIIGPERSGSTFHVDPNSSIYSHHFRSIMKSKCMECSYYWC